MKRSWFRHLLRVNDVLATLIVDAVLVAILLVVLSSILPPSGGTGNRGLNKAWTSVLAITPGNAPNGGGRLEGSRPFTITVADLDAIIRSIPDIAVLSRVVSSTAP